MILLTFLGTGRYEQATYLWRTPVGALLEHSARYAPAATSHFLQPDSVIVLVTSEARAAHMAALRQEIGPGVDIQEEEIPVGKNEQELWEIFRAVASCAGQKGSVALDITHGFRSLPLVAVLAVAFLRAARQVDVAHIVYGAWEARDASVVPPRTPLFDLTPMLSLLEWAIAAERLRSLGDARDMADLLRAARPAWTDCAQSVPLRELNRDLGRLSNKLDEISLDLQFIRPHDTLRAAHDLSDQLENAEAFAPSVRPFAEVIAQVRNSFAGLALAEPTQPESLCANLKQQRCLIHWYLERQYYVQAVTLAREWMVSLHVVRQGGADLMDRSARGRAEELLGRMHADVRAGRSDERLGKLWGLLCDVRNDINHAGMRRGALKPATLVEKIEYCVGEIDRLPIP